MKANIVDLLQRPAELERLYREDGAAFKKEFELLSPRFRNEPIVQFWHERLNYSSDDSQWGTSKELIGLVLIALFAGFLAQIPLLFNVDKAFFYPRNLGFLVFPILTGYFLWKNNLAIRRVLWLLAAILAGLLFVNFLPLGEYQTLILTCIHVPILLYFGLAYAHAGGNLKNFEKRIDFLRFNGELIVMFALILLSGFLFTALSAALLSLVQLNLEPYAAHYVACGLAAAPIVSTYLIEKNPELVNRVSPAIARIFSPLVLVTLVVFLLNVLVEGKDPFNDRDFLLVLNILLIAVLAIIFFSVSAVSSGKINKFLLGVLFLIALLATIVNLIALAAIAFRISEWGLTPNRAAVIGANILILSHVIWIDIQLYQSLKSSEKLHLVNKAIVVFLPLYFFWAAFVAFLFPLIFNFK
ncbi:hypothetical protein LAG90_14530 [Marinilongibacter aquaticus]|uniref:hypothetical protein n=1 Tax=Marinilongibacter aquaticus TaxID=2975157 RepID=UPI0021BD79EE|nr:hypothetical protein [Marinilongibacter aquaticus]UBM58020.1 hypothetical protein LAG90_14530 [Marinilongibacter aquaticus]